MRLTIAYSKIKKRNLVLINNDTYQRETLSELPIRQPLMSSQSYAIIKLLSQRLWGPDNLACNIFNLSRNKNVSSGHYKLST